MTIVSADKAPWSAVPASFVKYLLQNQRTGSKYLFCMESDGLLWARSLDFAAIKWTERHCTYHDCWTEWNRRDPKLPAKSTISVYFIPSVLEYS